MKKTIRICAVAMMLMLCAGQSAYAGNDERRGTAGAADLLINPWAGSNGWGGINIANARGIESMFNNVAGLSFVNNIEVCYSTMLLNGGKNGLVSGATINSFGLGVRVFESGVLGVYIMASSFGDIPITTYESPDPGANGSYSPSYMNINVAYAHSFTNTIHGAFNLKLITETTNNISGSGFAIDAGIQYVTGENDELKFGIALKNWGPSMKFGGTGHSLIMVNNSGNNFTVETRAAEMELPTFLNIGLSYDFLFERWNQRLTIAGSFTSNAFLRDKYGLGVEYGLLDMLQLRCGYVMEPGMWSSNSPTASTGVYAGASVDVPISKDGGSGLTINYSYNTNRNLRGTHAIGASFRF